MSIQTKIDYLKLPTYELLEKFGEGSHVPGSGSAAAFSGLLGVELMKTVCKLTISRTEDKYVKVRREFEIILEQVEKAKIELIELFQEDAECFNQVSQYRFKRDAAKKNKDDKEVSKFKKIENDLMKEATEIPLKIARTCLSITDYGFIIFDKGFQSARGDSGVAISNLLSAISGSLFVTLLNIKTRRTSQWTEKLREEAEKIGQSYNTKQKLALSKVLDLYKEGITIEDYQFKLNFD
ncbi:MAG: hypothetical protein GQ574_25705 [Crocinitomix sp.]|nr:hypothetical protein [Crocinitomix sp.]